jgi:ParB-like chromosome segregation protein Spo0J
VILTREQEIQKHIAVLGITREQAEQLWLEDNTDYVNEEMAEMEQKAKANRRYEVSDKPRAKAKREPKIDEDKVKIINFLMQALADGDVSQLEVKNPQREVAFQFNGADYSLTLTKHKPPK